MRCDQIFPVGVVVLVWEDVYIRNKQPLVNFEKKMPFFEITVYFLHCPQEYIQQPLALQIVSYVGLGVSIMALVFTFFTLLCIPRLHCNLNSIHVNLVFTLITAEVTFLVGINTENNVRLVAVTQFF